MHSPSAKISRLSESTINQIAAGEVIERPSGVIRELIENSIDAGADEISISINYDDLAITIKDNGCGIPSDQIALAFERHSTSKIRESQDLTRLHTLGFRGEALASIASIGKVTIKTAKNEEGVGVEAYLVGGKIESSKKISHSKGTEITIRDLFYNTPVRKKFFNLNLSDTQDTSKNQTTIDSTPLVIKPGERRAIKEEVIYHILSSEGIHFRYTTISTHKGKLKESEEINLPKSFDLKNKIIHFYRTRDAQHPLADTLISVDETVGDFKISGYITNLHCREKRNQKQFLMIMQRVVRDPYFIKSVQSAYLHKIPQGSHPICFIKVELPTEDIDMNTHPRKEQVKFRDPNAFFKAISIAVKNTLSKHHFNSANNPPTGDFSTDDTSNLLSVAEPRSNVLPNGLNFNNPFNDSSPEKQRLREKYFADTSDHPQTFPQTPPPSLSNTEPNRQPHLTDGSSHQFFVLGQVAKCYLLFSIGNDLFITDQHAAHERINFDKINLHLKNKNDQQILLIPLLFEKTNNELQKIIEQKEHLATLGFELEAFGETTIRISKVPAYLTEKKIKLITEDMLDLASQQEVINSEEFIGQLTARMACRMSVMAGDLLSREEMKSLIQEIVEKDYIYTCPHGRPFVKKINETELKHFFDRGRHIM